MILSVMATIMFSMCLLSIHMYDSYKKRMRGTEGWQRILYQDRAGQYGAYAVSFGIGGCIMLWTALQ